MANELEDTFFRVLTHLSPDAEAWRLPENPDSLLASEDDDFIVTEDEELIVI